MTADNRIPVTVLSGYLGSGKTTLLRHLLEGEQGPRTAVLINEFGEIGLDHLIVRPVAGDAVILRNGCICCSVRSELRGALRSLLDARLEDGFPRFDRILIETTGLADPVPLVQTLVVDPMLRHQVTLAGLVSTVDALNGLEQLATHSEAARQAAGADKLVITKVDLQDARPIARLRRALATINPMARIVLSPGPASELLWKELMGPDADRARGSRVFARAENVIPGEVETMHKDGVRSFVVRTDPVDWTAFAVWLSLLVHRHGSKVLRVKGLLNVPGSAGPIWLNAVQHFVHPPVHLDRWPDEDRSSRIVFIVQDLPESAIRASLDAVLLQADRELVRETA
jgi:G3E family GTPase